MSKLYIALLAIAAFMISAIGAVFSIAGLTSLFAGATLTVGLMAGSLEFAKLVTAGFIYRYWGHINIVMRSYLTVAIVILSLITSMGIFGYLSNAYQRSSLPLKAQMLEVDALKDEDHRIAEEIEKTNAFIKEIPNSRISKKLALFAESRAHINSLHQQSMNLHKKMEGLLQKKLTMQTEIGPIIYVAETLHTDVDSVAKFLIFIFVSVFDPLAICLVFALNLAIRLKEKYRNNEDRIARLSISKPVDHRFKKSA